MNTESKPYVAQKGAVQGFIGLFRNTNGKVLYKMNVDGIDELVLLAGADKVGLPNPQFDGDKKWIGEYKVGIFGWREEPRDTEDGKHYRNITFLVDASVDPIRIKTKATKLPELNASAFMSSSDETAKSASTPAVDSDINGQSEEEQQINF